jgi:uncharacterized membrane protein
MKKYFYIIAILITATVLRFYHNLDISLWHDEAFSALLINYSWPEMMYRIGLDVHPPMYYIFLRLWHYIFGDSLLSLRGMTIFFSVGSVWAAWLFVKTAFQNEKAALVSALLIAVNPFQIQYASEARMYTMGAFFALLGAYFLVSALRHQKMYLNNEHQLNIPNLPSELSLKRRFRLEYLAFVLCLIVITYTHYYLLFTAAAFGIFGLAYLLYHHRSNFQSSLWFLGAWLLAGLAYLPWLKTFLFQYRQVGAGYWIPPMDTWSVPSTLWTLIIGFGHDVNNPTTQKWLVVITLITLFIVFRFLKKTQGTEKWLVLLTTLAPFGGSLLFLILAKLKGSESSVYLVRYFLFTSSFLSVIIAVWLTQIKWKSVSKILLLGLCLVNLTAFFSYWQDINVKTRPGMNAAAKMLQVNVEPHHKLYVGSSFMFFNLKYYLTQYPLSNPEIRPLLFSGGNRDIKNLPHFAGTAILTNQDLLPDFKEATKTGDTVWLLWTNGFGGSKPETPKNWTQVEEKSYPEVRLYLGTNVYINEYKVN